jgi:hypothetical protein
VLKLTASQIRVLRECGFEIDGFNEVATCQMLASLFRFDDGTWGREVQFEKDGQTLDELLTYELAAAEDATAL